MAIDPRVSFGQPVVVGTGVPAAMLAQRYAAGESIDELAVDYDCDRLQVEGVIRYELPLTAWTRKWRSSFLSEVWLQAVAAKEWVVLTADKRIAYRRLEKMAIEQSGAKVFVLVSGNLSGVEMAAIFVKAIGAMTSFVLKTPAPFIAKVYKDGRVQAWN